jgi:hypothetical protein
VKPVAALRYWRDSDRSRVTLVIKGKTKKENQRLLEVAVYDSFENVDGLQIYKKKLDVSDEAVLSFLDSVAAVSTWDQQKYRVAAARRSEG